MPGEPFCEMENARIAYGLLPAGPTDLVQLMMVEYVSSYGDDWFVVPLTLPVGSITRINSLVVFDTFGVKSLLQPLGPLPQLRPISPCGRQPSAAVGRSGWAWQAVVEPVFPAAPVLAPS